MRKILIIILAGFILLNSFGNATAQEEECDEADKDCITCRDNSFYFVLIAGFVVFTIFFYLRNKGEIE
ncbi:MAG: hypothetical protein KAR56_03160 [Thermoplasmata archaeon]|nr:hypothetical protein [Thermoplasmata archaeon]